MDIFQIKNTPVISVKGVGDERAKTLSKLNISTVYDLLFYPPREYEDRSQLKDIAMLEDGEMVCVYAIISTNPVERRIRQGLSILKFGIKDSSGNATITFYNQPYVKNTLKFGQKFYFYGKIYKSYGVTEMQNPSYDRQSQGIVPVYPLVKGLSQNILKNMIKAAFDKIGVIEDYLPDKIREEYNLCDINYAVRGIHFPENTEHSRVCRKRLIFDELLILQLSLSKLRNKLKDEVDGFAFKKVPEISSFINKLPFKLTDAQIQVFSEIEEDMESNKVMNRLVQGDVGSGKTIVALLAMIKAVKSGYQAAYMAPTEILAEQHFKNISGLLENSHFERSEEFMNIKVVLLKGGQSKKEREEALRLISEGDAGIIIGTHALIQEAVVFKKLGLVITDEQHRFGVRQRTVLTEKSSGVPDVLVMTATPIPRTLALILYGDLDISIIDKLPEGRIPIKTYVVDESMRPRINKFILKNIDEGRQVYIVCPAIEESGEETDTQGSSFLKLNDNLKKAEEYYTETSRTIFQNISCGIIHGKLKTAEKEKTMFDFYTGKIKILIATTVIEVGVDVPNASLIVVENAERFGLAQLHQLRGRVGRGQYQSYCILYNQSKSDISKERMDVMEKTSDGFIISQKDLQLRGPGEFFGTRQHGIPALRIANLYEDTNVLKDAQKAAGYILEYEYSMEGKYEALLNFRTNF